MGWGGVKSFRSEGSKRWGSAALSHHRRSNGNTAHAKFSFGGSNPGRTTVVGGGAAIFARPGFELPTEKTPVSCITIRPLLLRGKMSPHCLGPRLPLTKNPNGVFLCD